MNKIWTRVGLLSVSTFLGSVVVLGSGSVPTASELARKASAAYEQGDHQGCAQLYLAAVDAGAANPTTYYNAACCLALSGAADQALSLLGQAASRGLRDAALLVSDPDLISLLESPAWTEIVGTVEANRDAYLAQVDIELYEMYLEDQSDRSSGNVDWADMSQRDEERRERANEILAQGGLVAADDYYHAAMIFQHGSTPEHYERALALARTAVEIDSTHSSARWLTAAAQDRYLHSIGEPQWYGTQFRDPGDGVWTIDPIDTTRVTDTERAWHGVPTLAETREREAAMNR